MIDTTLQIESLSLAIRGTPILDNVSARIGTGEIWSIIGSNGAGKSTLLKCILRIHSNWTGSIRLFGEDIRRITQKKLAQRVAYVPQPGGDQRFPFTVAEFVRMGRYAYSGPFGTARPGDHAAIASAMQSTGVDVFADRTLDSLSGGERQKVFIAAALAQQSDVLLLDEPTAFLDYRHQAEIAKILRAINRDNGTAVVSVTHDVNSAMLTGGSALALRRGSTVWMGPADHLADASLLASIFGASFRFLDDPVSGKRLIAPQGVDA